MKHDRTFHVLRKCRFKNVEKNFISTTATAFETHDTILTQEQADHINERHVYITKHPRTSKFWLTFNLSSAFADLSQRPWETHEDVQLLEDGRKEGHGHYYLYVFAVHETIGKDPEGFPAKHIAIL